jgi:hypothetical protein
MFTLNWRFFFSEVVLSLLTDWHRKQEDYDSHYMWNVSLPGNWVWLEKNIYFEVFLSRTSPGNLSENI